MFVNADLGREQLRQDPVRERPAQLVGFDAAEKALLPDRCCHERAVPHYEWRAPEVGRTLK